MTRLKSADVVQIPGTLGQYDRELRHKTGSSLLEIAENAAGTNASVRRILKKTTAAVVPVSCGRGVIDGFAVAVTAILTHIGINSVITQADIVGISKAYEQKTDLMLIADDKKFVAINVRTRRVVDNATSTAKAYVAALDKMAGGLERKTVLVIGVGSVGSAAISTLILRNARPLIVDIDAVKLRLLRDTFGPKVSSCERLSEALSKTNLIINTAPARNIIGANMLRRGTLVSAPAIPSGLTAAALRKVGQNVVHDPLQLGVATMAVEACSN